MGLTEIQRALAQLYTDAGLRERFLADPRAVARALGLDRDDAEHLARLPAQPLRIFARSLLQKRMNAVARLLPLTHEGLGPEWEALFLRYADTRVPAGTQRHREDAIAFAAFLARLPGTEGIEPWLADLVRYEAAWLQAARPECRFLARRFRYAVGALAQQRAAEKPAPPRRRATLAVWVRPWRRGRLRHLLLSLRRE
jgi:hypothetical protein